MRLNIVLLLAFQFVVCAVDKATVKTNSDWILFSSKEGRFSVLMPQAPTHAEEKQKMDVGEATLHIYSSDPSPSFSYVVMYNDFPIGFRKDRSKAYLDGMQKEILADDGELLNQRDFNFGEYDARELKLLRSKKVEITIRVYLVENRMYQTISGVATNLVPSTNTVRFLDSFRLVR